MACRKPDLRDTLRRAIFLMGPTAAGKTDVAIHLATNLPLEIISVDSAMVYRHMDIGTDKPSPAIRARVPHHLIDVAEPWEAYSAGQFRQDALRIMQEIWSRGRVPLLVGGTMLYFRALRRGLAPLPAADRALRARIDRRGDEVGWPALHAELGRLDPLAARRIQPADRQRIQRALEVYQLTGQPISSLQHETLPGEDVSYLRIAMVPGARDVLYRRLDERLEAMLQKGFLDEVRKLTRMKEMSSACPSMRAVGYRQLWRHLAGAISLSEARRQAKVATHRLAKRQLSWLRSEAGDRVVDPQDGDAAATVRRHIEKWGVVAA